MNLNKGFTLIELLVSLAIIVLLTLIAIPLFRGSGERNKLNFAAQEVKDGIQETKNYALSPRKDNNVTFYTIKFQRDASNLYQYIIYEGNDITGKIIDVKTLHKTIEINTPSILPFSIKFSIKDRGAIIEPNTSDEIVIILGDTVISNIAKTIKINRTSGQVKIE